MKKHEALGNRGNNEFSKQVTSDTDGATDPTTKKTSLTSRLLEPISEIFKPILGVMMAGGFIVSMLNLVCVFAPELRGTTTYTVIYGIGFAVFEFMPVVVA